MNNFDKIIKRFINTKAKVTCKTSSFFCEIDICYLKDYKSQNLKDLIKKIKSNKTSYNYYTSP